MEGECGWVWPIKLKDLVRKCERSKNIWQTKYGSTSLSVSIVSRETAFDRER